MAEPRTEPRGWELSSTCCHTQMTAEAHGRTIALAETGAQALAQILSSQARAKFGAENPSAKSLLDALGAARAIDRLKQLGLSLLEAGDGSSWLAGIEAPPPAPNDFPEFALDDEIDLEPEKAFIDVTAQVATFAGKKMILQMRLQKWYQADMGKLLYEEARRLEKEFKATALMLVILMWPSADGPGINGHYRSKDKKGRPINFRYELKRAWEMPPDTALSSPGTMMLLPLSKGAKERMPELIRTMKERLAKMKPDEKTVETLWASFYFSMGMVCTLEESHSLLNDMLPMIHSTSDYKRVYGGGFRKGYTQSLKDGPIMATRDLIRQQVSKRFGEDPASISALEALDSYEALKAVAIRVPAAAGWSDLLSTTSPQ